MLSEKRKEMTKSHRKSMKMQTVILSRKTQRGRCAGVLVDAEKDRDAEYSADGVSNWWDQVVAYPHIIQMLVTFV